MIAVVVALSVTIWWWWNRNEMSELGTASLREVPPVPSLGQPSKFASVAAEPQVPRPRVLSLRTAAVEAGLDAGDGDQAFNETARRQLEVGVWLRKNADAAEQLVDQFCERSRAMAEMLGEASSGTRDAATYLSVRVDWEGEHGQPGPVGLLRLPTALNERMKRFAPGTWVTQLNANDWAGLDFGWLTELQGFDVWSLTADGPLKNRDAFDFFEAPIPNYITLQSWAKLRLAKGLAENDVPRASIEVRHLADLIASNGTLVSEMIRLTLLNFLRLAWDAAGQPAPTSLLQKPSAPQNRDVLLAAPYFLYPGVSPEVRRKALACSPMKCTALIEGYSAHVAFGNAVPFSASDRAWFEAQHFCDPSVAARVDRAGPRPFNRLGDLIQGQGVERLLGEAQNPP